MKRFITAVTVQKFIGEASTIESERLQLVEQLLNVVLQEALPAAVSRLLRADAAVGAELDVLVDQVDLLRFRPGLPRRGKDLLDRRVDHSAFAIGAEDGCHSHWK